MRDMTRTTLPQVSSDKKETLGLLLLLLCFALCAATYVIREGLAEGKKSHYELLLKAVLILTSVVPPELPMQTALAVNTALMALMKAQVSSSCSSCSSRSSSGGSSQHGTHGAHEGPGHRPTPTNLTD